MSLAGEEACDPVKRRTFYPLLSGFLDSFSFTLFCLPFSAVIHVVSSVWCRFLTEGELPRR